MERIGVSCRNLLYVRFARRACGFVYRKFSQFRRNKLMMFLRDCRLFYVFFHQWMSAKKLTNVNHGERVLIIPCDPWGVVGSRGDQAMIMAVMQRCQDREIDILTDSHDTDAACKELGLNPICGWCEPFDEWMRGNADKYAEVFILGADVTDGVYGWRTAMKLLMFYDCFARIGMAVHYLGFSWSETPSPWMKLVFMLLKSDLPLPVRDPVSYERVARFTRHRPLVQVADVAFQLNPHETIRSRHWVDWCRSERAGGRKVVAINVHQMFNDASTKSADWEIAFAQALNNLKKDHPEIIYLLVPHDNRRNASDLEILTRIADKIDGARLVGEVMNADEVKFLMGECDALIAGRMHISIAALGMGVPVFGLAYQGKFEGLWRHFGLPQSMLVAPESFVIDPEMAIKNLNEFVGSLVKLRETLAKTLLYVLKLSGDNFR